MKISFKDIIKYVLGILLAGVLLYVAFKDIQWKEMKESMHHISYTWVALSMVIGIAEKCIRAARWRMLIQATGHQTRFISTFCGVAVGYLANMVLPRMGEITRCGVVSKADKVPFAQAFGTVVVERVVDVITLLLVIVLALGLEYGVLSHWLNTNFKFSQERKQLFIILGIVFVVAGVVGFWLMIRFLKRFNPKQKWIIKVKTFIEGLAEGLLSIKKVNNIGLFVTYTVLIWLCYTLTSYCIFKAMESTAHLGLSTALVVTLVGAIGMAAPVQGGIGVYHYIVSQSMIAYQISAKDSLVSTTLNHTSQAILVVVAGIICLLVSIKILYPKKEIEHTEKG